MCRKTEKDKMEGLRKKKSWCSRETDSQTDSQTDRETERQTVRQTERQRDRQERIIFS